MARLRKKVSDVAASALRTRRKKERSERRVSHLAKNAGLSLKSSIDRLLNANIQVHGASDLVPKKEVLRAREILKKEEKQIQSESGFPAESMSLASPKSTTQKQNRETIDHKAEKIKRTMEKPDIDYLTISNVKAIHNKLVEDFQKSSDPIDPPGVKDETLLDSAVNRPHTNIDGKLKYDNVYSATGAYLHALIGNHPFHNGNKRTALVSALAFLNLNDITLDGVNKDDLYKYVIKIASHEIDQKEPRTTLPDREVNLIASWIRKHSRSISKQEILSKVRDVKTILERNGCSWESQAGNKVTIKREFNGETYISKAGYRNFGDEWDKQTIHRIRKDLHLTEEYGIDSITFYKKEGRIPEFINKYRKILQRLANS